MKIAMFGHKSIPSREGGVEIVVEELSTRMVSLGHQVVCYNRAGHHVSSADERTGHLKEYKGVRCKRTWTIDKKGLAAVTSSFFAAILSAFGRAKVVHIHAEGPAFMCWLPKLFRKRVVVTVHGLDWQREKWKGGFGSRYIHAGEKMAVRFADEIIVLSKNAQEYFLATYNKATTYIPNGISQPNVVPGKKIKEQFELEKNGFILFLGRLVPEKGIHYLIEAFRQTHTDKKLVIAGGTSDTNEYVQKLQDAASDDDRIVFTGFVQGRVLEELFSNAYVYVLPSDVEGMPLSLLEAMSYGNCCLVSDIPECTEVVQNRAVTFKKANIGDLAVKLQFLCDSPSCVKEFQENAQAYICEKYNWDDVVQKTLELYQ